MLLEVKDYLNITWDDELIESKLERLIAESKYSLNTIVGVQLNYDTDYFSKELLLNRVRYAYNNSLEYFEDNFSKEILRLQLLKGVEENDKQKNENEQNK